MCVYTRYTLQTSLLFIIVLLQVVFHVHGQLDGFVLPTLTIVHLGDSFSSGSGARDADGNPNWIGPPTCYRSPYNWGQILANTLNDTYTVNYTNSACGGATVSAVVNDTKRSTMVIPKQIDYVTANVDYILMSIGANDLGTKQMLFGCYMKGIRDVVTCRDQIEYVRSNFRLFRARLVGALLLIEESLNPKNTNPEANVIIVSYPHTITSTPYYLTDKFSDDTIDISTVIRQLELDGDKLLRDIVQEVNEIVDRNYAVLFDRTKELFMGHEPDPSYEFENPDGWFWEFNAVDIREWYHINSEGHIQLGNSLSLFFTEDLLVVSSLVQYEDTCPHTFSLCALWGSLFRLFPFFSQIHK